MGLHGSLVEKGEGRQGRMSALKFWGPRLRILGALGLNRTIS